jgi:RNA polymerase sigma factor (sigma-70 family)
MDPRAAEIVRLRFFLGFTQEEIADLLEVSRATVGRDWASARAWLWREMGEQVDWKGD